jgi:hypothetical protein
MTLKPCPDPWCESSSPPYITTVNRPRVVCHCGVLGPVCNTQAEATTAWNTRPADEALKEAREALKPFADQLKGNYSKQSDTMPLSCGFNQWDQRFKFTLGEFRRAAAVLARLDKLLGEG